MPALTLALVLGYAAGSLSPAVLIARARGIDLRAVGSGNPGATNAGRAMGRRTGVVVGLLDVAKGAAPAVAFGAVDHRAGLVAGVAAVLGHVTSPFLRGRGGRGVATAAGAVLGVHPLWALVVVLVWVAVLAVARWVALASVTAAVAVPVLAVFEGRDLLWAMLLAAVVVGRHQVHLLRWLRPQPS